MRTRRFVHFTVIGEAIKSTESKSACYFESASVSCQLIPLSQRTCESACSHRLRRADGAGELFKDTVGFCDLRIVASAVIADNICNAAVNFFHLLISPSVVAKLQEQGERFNRLANIVKLDAPGIIFIDEFETHTVVFIEMCIEMTYIGSLNLGRDLGAGVFFVVIHQINAASDRVLHQRSGTAVSEALAIGAVACIGKMRTHIQLSCKDALTVTHAQHKAEIQIRIVPFNYIFHDLFSLTY